ncbi:hypothetical protein HHI36_014304 [Cryptolaemus montrouzieri]|uniref:Uncharacterized protein n=1 Tax=Cryptolaemus montrouzieri TaxID=559131 RepID=A0ABD2N2M8_9CUCU
MQDNLKMELDKCVFDDDNYDGDYSFFDARTDQMYIPSSDEAVLQNSDSFSKNEENHDLESTTKKITIPKERN